MEQISAAVSERPCSDAHTRYGQRSSTKQFQAFLASCDAQHTERFHQRRNLPGDTGRVGVLLNLHHPQGSFVLKTEIMSQSARLRTAEMPEVHSHSYEMNNIARAQISGEVLLHGKLQPHANVVRLIAFNVAIKAVKDDLADVRVMMLTRRARLHLDLGTVYIDSKSQHILNSKRAPHVMQHIARKMLEGIQHLHANKISHRDVKPYNTVLDAESINDSTNLLLCDFGSAVAFGTKAESCAGTASYAADEVHADPSSVIASEQQDMASFGYTLFAIAFGRPYITSVQMTTPQARQLRQEHIESRLKEAYNGTAFQDLILALIGPCGTRPSAAQALKHRWFSSNSQQPAKPIVLVPLGVSTPLVEKNDFGLVAKEPITIFGAPHACWFRFSKTDATWYRALKVFVLPDQKTIRIVRQTSEATPDDAQVFALTHDITQCWSAHHIKNIHIVAVETVSRPSYDHLLSERIDSVQIARNLQTTDHPCFSVDRSGTTLLRVPTKSADHRTTELQVLPSYGENASDTRPDSDYHWLEARQIEDSQVWYCLTRHVSSRTTQDRSSRYYGILFAAPQSGTLAPHGFSYLRIIKSLSGTASAQIKILQAGKWQWSSTSLHFESSPF